MPVYKRKQLAGNRAPAMILVALSVLAAPLLSLNALAAGTSPTTSPPSATSSLNLNLASTNAAVAATRSGTIILGGKISPHGTVSGGSLMSVNAGQLLTPAENAALLQTIMSGAQHLVLNTSGAAVGGIEKLSSSWSGDLASLVVPKGVTVDAINFNTSHPLNVAGASNILGSLYSLQTTRGSTSILNFGDDLNIGAGGLLSGRLPTAQVLPGLFASQILTLNVAGQLTNSGIVTARNINIVSASGQITNSGTISASGMLNINTLNPSTDLVIDNRGGVLQAELANGAINIRASGPDIESANAGIWGGLLSAPGRINMFGKDMVVQVDQIVGAISNTGSQAHISVNTGTLKLGDQILSGDPTYFNNGGSLQIGSITSVDGNLVMVASGDISLANPTTTISTTSTAANSSVFIGAGLNFNNGGGTNVGLFADNNPGDTTSNLTNFTAGTGSINSGGTKNLSITVTGSGTVTLVASQGDINMGAGTISAATGNVLLIGENGVSTTGSITTTSGNIMVASATPASLNTLSFTQPNTVINGAPTVPATFTSHSVNTAGLITTSGNISVQSDGAVHVSTGISSPLSGGDVTVSSTGSTVQVDGVVNTTGNVILAQNSSTTLEDTASSTGAGIINGAINGMTVTLSNTNSSGKVLLDAAVTTINSASKAVILTAGASGANAITQTINGPVSQTGGVGSTVLTLNLLGDATSTGNLTTAANSVLTLNSTGASGSTISLTNASGNSVALGTFSTGQNLTVVTTGSGTVTTTHPITLGNVDLTGGTNLTITNPITSNGATGNLTATTGNILIDASTSGTTGAFVGTSDKTLTALTGTIILNGPVAGPTVTLISGINSANGVTQNANGAITGSAVGTAATLAVILNGVGASSATLTAAQNNVSKLTGSGNFDSSISLTNGTNNSLALGSFSSNQLLTVTTSGLGAVSTTTNLNMQGVNITGGSVNITNTITSPGAVAVTATDGPIDFNSHPGQPLSITGDWLLSAADVNYSTSGNGVNFAGNTVVNGNANVFAITTAITGSAGSVMVNGNLTTTSQSVDPSIFTVSGKSTFSFPASNFSVGTIVNPTGDVVLTKNTIVNSTGKSLAIIAEGSVIASGLTTINLGSSKGQGGTLTVIAGYSFSGPGSGQTLDTSNAYTLLSPTGGNIDLAKVTINTASTATTSSTAGLNGGNIFLLAASGNGNAGNIVVGPVNTSSTNGFGGSVEMIAPGGIVVNGTITTGGKTGGGAVTLAGSSAATSGSPIVQDGYLFGGFIQPSNPTAGSGSAVSVTGAISTKSSAGSAGAVTITADQQITTAAITTSGFQPPGVGPTAGGSVLLSSLEGFVTIGAITTSASSITSATATQASGDGGTIAITAASNINTGSLITTGGSGVTSFGAGAGGDVTLTTGTIAIGASGPAAGYFDGAITVKGLINTSGGNDNGKPNLTGGGGAGGDVTASGATFTVTAGGVSIQASGGKADLPQNTGNGGTVNIQTYALQAVPTAFDLTSTTRNIPAVPGGMFSVGVSAPINGVAGTISTNTVAGSTVTPITVTKESAGPNGQISSTNPVTGTVSITVSEISFSITEGSQHPVITSVQTQGGPRLMLTPAEALAAFQVGRNGVGSQTIDLSSPNPAKPTQGANATGSSAAVVIDQVALSGITFKSFKDTNVALDFIGQRPVINLPSAATIGAAVTFDGGATAYINAGAGALTFGAGSSILAQATTLIISGTSGSWTNNGQIDVLELALARPSTGALTFTTGPGATTKSTAAGAIVIGPSFDAGMNMTFKANAATEFSTPVVFFSVPMPTMYSANAIVNANNAATVPTVTLNFALGKSDHTAITAQVAGNINATKLTINATAATVTAGGVTSKVNTPLTILSGSTLTGSTGVIVTSAGTLQVDQGASLTGGVFNGATLTPGVPIAHADILKAGGVSLTSSTGNVTLGTGDTLAANGGNVAITSKLGSINLGGDGTVADANTLQANGGRVVVLAKLTVTDGGGNTFNAFSTDQTTNTGGGIEIGSGTTTSMLSAAASRTGGVVTGSFDTPPSPINFNGTNGVVVVNKTGTGTVNLVINSGITLHSGGVVFDAIGNGSAVSLTTDQFNVTALKPVSSTSLPGQAEIIVDSGVDE